MQVQERPDAAVQATPDNAEGRINRSRRWLAVRFGIVASTIVGVIAGTAGVSSAATSVTGSDLTNGAGDTFFTSITNYLTDHLIVSVLTLFAIVTGVAMLIKWGGKVAKR